MLQLSTSRRTVPGLSLALVLLAAAFCIVSPRANASPVAADPIQTALQAGKPTVAEFGSDRCHSCKQMKIVLTEEHLRLMVEGHLLKPGEVSDAERLLAVVQELVDRAIGFPKQSWHQWDDWVKGLE